MWILGGQTVEDSLVEGVWFKDHSKGGMEIRNAGIGTFRDCTGAKRGNSFKQNEEGAFK